MTGGLCLGRGGASGGMGHWSQFQRISPPGGCEVTGATERKCLVRDQQSPETEGWRAGAFTGQMRVAASGRTRGRTGVAPGLSSVRWRRWGHGRTPAVAHRRTGPASGRFPGAPGRAHLIRSVTLAEQRRHLHKRLRFFLRGQSTLSVVRINAESCYLPGVRSFEFNQ